MHVNGSEARAQVNTGTLSGQVSDATGAVVPAATLTIRDQNTGYTRQVTSDGEGNYVFPDLPIGKYTVTVEANGFETERGAATINVGVRSRSDFRVSASGKSSAMCVSEIWAMIIVARRNTREGL